MFRISQIDIGTASFYLHKWERINSNKQERDLHRPDRTAANTFLDFIKRERQVYFSVAQVFETQKIDARKKRRRSMSVRRLRAQHLAAKIRSLTK